MIVNCPNCQRKFKIENFFYDSSEFEVVCKFCQDVFNVSPPKTKLNSLKEGPEGQSEASEPPVGEDEQTAPPIGFSSSPLTAPSRGKVGKTDEWDIFGESAEGQAEEDPFGGASIANAETAFLLKDDRASSNSIEPDDELTDAMAGGENTENVDEHPGSRGGLAGGASANAFAGADEIDDALSVLDQENSFSGAAHTGDEEDLLSLMDGELDEEPDSQPIKKRSQAGSKPISAPTVVVSDQGLKHFADDIEDSDDLVNGSVDISLNNQLAAELEEQFQKGLSPDEEEAFLGFDNLQEKPSPVRSGSNPKAVDSGYEFSLAESQAPEGDATFEAKTGVDSLADDLESAFEDEVGHAFESPTSFSIPPEANPKKQVRAKRPPVRAADEEPVSQRRPNVTHADKDKMPESTDSASALAELFDESYVELVEDGEKSRPPVAIDQLESLNLELDVSEGVPPIARGSAPKGPKGGSPKKAKGSEGKHGFLEQTGYLPPITKVRSSPVSRTISSAISFFFVLAVVGLVGLFFMELLPEAGLWGEIKPYVLKLTGGESRTGRERLTYVSGYRGESLGYNGLIFVEGVVSQYETSASRMKDNVILELATYDKVGNQLHTWIYQVGSEPKLQIPDELPEGMTREVFQALFQDLNAQTHPAPSGAVAFLLVLSDPDQHVAEYQIERIR